MDARRSTEPLVQHRFGFTVLELLVTVTVAMTLLAILLPALGGARESSRRTRCAEHLRQIGLALQNHESSLGHLPIGWKFDPSNRTAYGWAVSLLPYLEQPALADRIDFQRTIDDPNHVSACRTSIEMMLCPSDITDPTFILFKEPDKETPALSTAIGPSKLVPLMELPTANYVGVFGTLEPDDQVPAPLGDGAFLENRSTKYRDFQRGLSQTFVVGERTMAQVPSTWYGIDIRGEDAAGRVVGATLEGINHPLADECDFSSRHAGGANFLSGDGHVRFVTQQVDLLEYHRSAQLRIQ